MANISLQHISQLEEAGLNKESTFDNKYILLSEPFNQSTDYFKSTKLQLSALINTISGIADDNVDSHVERQLVNFKDSQLSGAIYNVLSDLLSSSRAVVTDADGRLTQSTITVDEIGRLKGCSVDITASLEVLDTNISGVSSIISTSYITRNEANSYTDAHIDQLSDTLSHVDSDLSNAITAIVLSVNTIGTSYVTNDDILNGLETLRGELCGVIDNVSAALYERINETSAAILESIDAVRNELAATNRNIQFILNYMNVNVQILSSYYDTTENKWKNIEMVDNLGQEVIGSLFQLDGGDNSFVNESYLLIGVQTPTADDIADLSVANSNLSSLGSSDINAIGAVSEHPLSIDIGSDSEVPSVSWIAAGTVHQNRDMAPEQLIFLNLN